jgi:hypothetical protein
VTALECPREAEVVAAVRQRAWRAADDDLRCHAEACPACAEVAAVCGALADDRDALQCALDPGNHALPSAGQVWHRATMRARVEALESASRSLVWAYGLAGATVAGLIAALVPSAWRASTLLWRVAETSVALQSGLILIAASGACLALASVAIYVAIRGDRQL